LSVNTSIQNVTLNNFNILNLLLCTFCLDTFHCFQQFKASISTKKIKADEKQLKLFERISRKKNSSGLLRTIGAICRTQTVFCFYICVLKFFDAVFHRPIEKRFYMMAVK